MDSFQDLKNKYLFHSQKQLERAKKASRHSKLMEAAERSNCKLLALKKELKIKMDQKKKEKYEKRLLMYKIANEEDEADYEKFFDEDENENNEIVENDVNMEQDLNNENNQLDLEDKESQSNLNEEEDDNSQSNSNKEEDDNSQSNSNEEDINSQEQNSEEDEENECDDESKSMDYLKPTDLINENRDLLTKMINKETQSQLNNEYLLGLCSAKVSSFIDDECEENDSMVLDNNLEKDEDNESDNEENDDLDNKNLDEKNKDEVNDDLKNELSNEKQNEEEFDILKERLKRHKELESDSDEEEFSFVNKFKFKKACKIEESDDEETNSKLNFKHKFDSIDEELNSNDIYDDLNSQDSQMNNRESTFLESKIDLGKPRFNLKEFIEDQAELSEEDKDKFSSDEEEDSNDEYEQEEIDENLPSDEEILKENNKIFMKQQMDEDRREILEYQERFLEFGDLHDDGDARQRKFKWKNVDNVWVDNVKDSSDSDEFDIQDSQIEFTSLHLKQIDEMNKTKEDESQTATQSSNSLSKEEKRKKKLMNTSLNKTHLSSYSTFDNSIFNKHMRTFKRTLNGPANDIQSYIIKDKNLVNAMSVKSSVVAANKQIKSKQQLQRQMDYGNKKRKTDKIENKKSIFDLF